MQQIINGLLYDTETSKCICLDLDDDFSGCEGLYKTNKGNYFLKYYVDGLESCTEEEAKKYFLKNIDGNRNTYEEYIEEFGDDIEKA